MNSTCRIRLNNCIWSFFPCRYTARFCGQPVTAALAEAVAAAGQGDIPRLCGAAGNLCAMLAEKGKLDSLPAAVAEEVLGDDNAYSAALTRRTFRTGSGGAGGAAGILAACTARPP